MCCYKKQRAMTKTIFIGKTIFCRKRWCFPCFLVFCRIGEYISLVLFYQFCQPHPVVVPQKKSIFFRIHEITRVVVLYASLQFVEGVYKPQRACVGWASATESRFEAWMGIKRTCSDELYAGHPKMFERTLDIISLFVLSISNTINFFLIFLCCSLWKC